MKLPSFSALFSMWGQEHLRPLIYLEKHFRHKTFKTLWVSERLKCLICLMSFLEKHTSEGSEREEDC